MWCCAFCAFVEKRQKYTYAEGNIHFRKHLEKIYKIVIFKTSIIGLKFSQTLINMS